MDKAQVGQKKIKAEDWNAIRQFLNDYSPELSGMINNPRNPFLVDVKNATDDDLPAFSVVRINSAMYDSRTLEVARNAALNNNVELSVDLPLGIPNENIAILQEDIPEGEIGKAIVCGVSFCKAVRPADRPDDIQVYQYAKTIDGVTDHLELTHLQTNIRVLYHDACASGNNALGYAFVQLEKIDDRKWFWINYANNDNISSIAKKGAIFRVYPTSQGYRIRSNRSNGAYILAVCQEDMPDGYTGKFKMPFYTPEMNYGEKPNQAVSMYSADSLVSHRGVIYGEYEFSNKRLDYVYQNGKYSYCPKFLYRGAAVSHNNGVGISIEGHTYPVTFPSIDATFSLTSYPDVYAGDIITVLVEDGGGSEYSSSVYAIDYPKDFRKGFSIVIEHGTYLGRGWDSEYIPDTNFDFAWKEQGNALI